MNWSCSFSANVSSYGGCLTAKVENLSQRTHILGDVSEHIYYCQHKGNLNSTLLARIQVCCCHENSTNQSMLEMWGVYSLEKKTTGHGTYHLCEIVLVAVLFGSWSEINFSDIWLPFNELDSAVNSTLAWAEDPRNSPDQTNEGGMWFFVARVVRG